MRQHIYYRENHYPYYIHKMPVIANRGYYGCNGIIKIAQEG